MTSDSNIPDNTLVQKIKTTGITCYCRSIALGKTFCIKFMIPCLYNGSRLVRREFIRIHEKQSWFHRCGATMAGNAIGLGMAMLSTRVVEHFVEVRSMSNLWGLLSSRPVVSETTYEIFSFIVEFVIALIVFTLSEHYYDEFINRRKNSSIAVGMEE